MDIRVIPLLTTCLALGGCGTTIYNVKIPLSPPHATVAADAANVTIDDRRPGFERSTHTGRNRFACERWYGDATFEPSKLAALEQLVAERVPPDKQVVLRLDRFDTIEYCANSASRAGAAAAYGASSASGSAVYVPPYTVAGGDSVHLRLTGEINGMPFDVARVFDYDGLPHKAFGMPSSGGRYRELLWTSMREAADAIVEQLPVAPAP
jgi:hypothetical protein